MECIGLTNNTTPWLSTTNEMATTRMASSPNTRLRVPMAQTYDGASSSFHEKRRPEGRLFHGLVQG